MKRYILPECPEIGKELCRMARARSCWVECLLLDNTKFKDHCPFYKTEEQYFEEVRRFGSDPLEYTKACRYLRQKRKEKKNVQSETSST